MIHFDINLCLLSKLEDETDASIAKGQFDDWTTDYSNNEFVERKITNTSCDNSLPMF